MSSARKIAISALTKVEIDGGYSNIVLDRVLSETDLDSRDKALASILFYGVLERKITLDYIISTYMKKPITTLKNFVLQSIRIALFQILYMDKIPNRAAVNESVNIVKNSKHRNAAGLVNAILRAFLRDEKQIKLPKDKMDSLSITYSTPSFIIESFINDYGEDIACGILQSSFNSKPIAIRVNTTKTTTDNLLQKLEEQGINATKDSLTDDSILLHNGGSVENLYGFKDGLFHVQDTASQLCAKAVCKSSPQRVLDVCAAPGGKTFTIAESLNGEGEVVSLDLYEHKIKLINSGKARLGLNNIKAMVNDASKFNEKLGKFDAVLCDLPCSGLGMLNKKPEIRYKNVGFLDNFANLQYHLLDTSAEYVCDGGVLIYSTCTLRHAENKEIAERFLKEHKDFIATPIYDDIKRGIPEEPNQLTLFPHIHNTDGFFLCAFTKRG